MDWETFQESNGADAGELGVVQLNGSSALCFGSGKDELAPVVNESEPAKGNAVGSGFICTEC